jgi:hypothetical protein
LSYVNTTETLPDSITCSPQKSGFVTAAIFGMQLEDFCYPNCYPTENNNTDSSSDDSDDK